MNESASEYQSKILDLATNRYLDQVVTLSEDNLKYIESNVDEVVWKVATQIYQQSGFKADLTRVKNIVISRIENMRVQVKLQAERRAVEEAQRKVAEEAQRAAKLRAEAEQKAAEEAQRVAQLRAEEERKAAEEAQRAAEFLEKFDGNPNKEEIFLKIRKIVSEELEIDELTIDVDTNIGQDLNTKSLEAIEIILALEEEFDIEIPDEEIDELSENTEKIEYENMMDLEFVVRKFMNHVYKKIYEKTETE